MLVPLDLLKRMQQIRTLVVRSEIPLPNLAITSEVMAFQIEYNVN